jgi:hypothetical protein
MEALEANPGSVVHLRVDVHHEGSVLEYDGCSLHPMPDRSPVVRASSPRTRGGQANVPGRVVAVRVHSTKPRH